MQKMSIKKNILKILFFFDIDKISDPNEKLLPHMFPSKEIFTYHMQRLGLNENHIVVIYDNSPLYSSARCWFLLRYFGKQKVIFLLSLFPLNAKDQDI